MAKVALLASVLLLGGVEARRHAPFRGVLAHQRKKAFKATPGDYLYVTDFGAQGGDCSSNVTGAFDNTAAFQKTIDTAAADGGVDVYVPAGCYRFKGTLNLTEGVVLQGSYAYAPSHDHRGVPGTVMPDDGSVLLPLAGRGNEDGTPFLTMATNTVLKGLVIFHMEQEKVNVPVPYPYAIFMNGNNAMVEDVELLNPWNGIKAVKAPRHTILRVQGQPLNIGIYIDETYDIGRVEDVHFNPWFSNQHPFMNHQLVFGRAFVFGRSDWEYVLNTFAYGYSVGYHFIKTATGAMNGNYVGIGMDNAVNASVLVDATQPFGVLITNGEFTAFHDSQWINTTQESSHVVISPSNTGAVSFVDSSFWGKSSQVAYLNGTGSTTFSACQFVQWDLQAVDGRAGVRAFGGSLILNGNVFHDNKTQVELGPKVKAVIANNILTGKKRFVIAEGAIAEVGNNAEDKM